MMLIYSAFADPEEVFIQPDNGAGGLNCNTTCNVQPSA